MSKLSEMTSTELAEVAREHAKKVREQNDRLDGMLSRLLSVVEEQSKRLDDNGA